MTFHDLLWLNVHFKPWTNIRTSQTWAQTNFHSMAIDYKSSYISYLTQFWVSYCRPWRSTECDDYQRTYFVPHRVPAPALQSTDQCWCLCFHQHITTIHIPQTMIQWVWRGVMLDTRERRNDATTNITTRRVASKLKIITVFSVMLIFQ